MKQLRRIFMLTLALLLAVSPALAACVHNWVSTGTKMAATCTDGGYEVFLCTLCGATKTHTEAALGHDPGAWKVKTQPSCTANGVSHQPCNRCGIELDSKPIPALGHDPGAWQVKFAAACDVAGVSHQICKRCGTELATAVIPALSHNWGAWAHVLIPTCTYPGYNERSCSLCGRVERVSVAATGHAWGAWGVGLAATCTHSGYEQRLCPVCNSVEYKTLNALGHDWGGWSNTKAPACEVPGTNERTCNRCGIKEIQVVPALKHNWGPYITLKPASCGVTGLSERECSICHAKQQMKLKAFTHAFGPWSTTLAPTCTTKGSESRTCALCGTVQTRAVKATGHKSDGIWQATRAAITRRKGEQVTHCTVCGQVARTSTYVQSSAFRYDTVAQAYGPMAGQISPALAGLTQRLIVLDPSVDGTYRFPLVAEEAYQVGWVTITVAGGTLTVRVDKLSEPTWLKNLAWQLYSGPDSVSVLTSASQPFGQPVAVSGPLAIIALRADCNYYRGNENKPFSDGLVAQDGIHNWAQVAEQMIELVAEK